MFLIMYNENDNEYVYINIIYFNIYLKTYYIVFVLLKKNEKGLRGKQQFEPFTQSQDIFSHFSTFYVKNICFFQTYFVY